MSERSLAPVGQPHPHWSRDWRVASCSLMVTILVGLGVGLLLTRHLNLQNRTIAPALGALGGLRLAGTVLGCCHRAHPLLPHQPAASPGLPPAPRPAEPVRRIDLPDPVGSWLLGGPQTLADIEEDPSTQLNHSFAFGNVTPPRIGYPARFQYTMMLTHEHFIRHLAEEAQRVATTPLASIWISENGAPYRPIRAVETPSGTVTTEWRGETGTITGPRDRLIVGVLHSKYTDLSPASAPAATPSDPEPISASRVPAAPEGTSSTAPPTIPSTASAAATAPAAPPPHTVAANSPFDERALKEFIGKGDFSLTTAFLPNTRDWNRDELNRELARGFIDRAQAAFTQLRYQRGGSMWIRGASDSWWRVMQVNAETVTGIIGDGTTREFACNQQLRVGVFSP